MSANWIKMRTDLLTHPKVVRISSALNADRLRVVGALWAVWGLFDAHSIDGVMEGYTLQVLDELIGFAGFSTAMAAVGWLEDRGQVLVAPRFDEHNGQSAKRRAQEVERKRGVRNLSACDADKKRTREEKRREDINPPNPPFGGQEFDEFISEFPESRRIKTAEARREFGEIVGSGEAQPQQLVLAMRRQAAAMARMWDQDGGKSCPAPARWLRERRWVDGEAGEGADAWSRTRSGVEAKGEGLGVGRWDEAAFNRGDGEPFPMYEQRVRAAVESTGQTAAISH